MHLQSRLNKPLHMNRVGQEMEDAVVALAESFPAFGQVRAAKAMPAGYRTDNTRQYLNSFIGTKGRSSKNMRVQRKYKRPARVSETRASLTP